MPKWELDWTPLPKKGEGFTTPPGEEWEWEPIGFSADGVLWKRARWVEEDTHREQRVAQLVTVLAERAWDVADEHVEALLQTVGALESENARLRGEVQRERGRAYSRGYAAGRRREGLDEPPHLRGIG